MDALLNLIRREVVRVMARYAHPVVGIITSYDPTTHSVKVRYQPEGTLSGWIPLNAAGVGAGFGVFVGPHVGHAVSIGFQEGDRESPFVIGRFATDVEIPVSVAEGEIVAKHESGSSLSLLKDGSVILSDKTGTAVQIDGAGNVGINSFGNGYVSLLSNNNTSYLQLLKNGTINLTAGGSSIVISPAGAISITLAAGQGMTVNGGAAGVSIDGAGNCTVNGTAVFLGGSTGTKKVVLDGDPVVAGAVVASSTIVRAK